MHDGWAAAQRRRWSAPRIAAAIGLHALLLALLTLAVDRVELPRRGADHATTLLALVLPAAPAPASHDLPPPRRAPPPPRLVAPAPLLLLQPTEAQRLSLPAPFAASAAPVAVAPASSAAPDLRSLDDPAIRLAIRNAARGQTLAGQANAITGTGQTAGERLAAGVDAAHKADCLKAAGGMGLLALPVLIAAEVMDKCAHKL